MEEKLVLAIESSCDETSAAVLLGTQVLSNEVVTQLQHAQYGGVVPEIASRAHQTMITAVVHAALKSANKELKDLDAIAVTQGPGLMGSLLVGISFAKSLSLALDIPLIGVNHMQAHILAHLADDCEKHPSFPFLNLTVSGGHTQLVVVHSPTRMEVVGETIDDAAGEAFDKAAKVLGLDYPGGPLLDKMAHTGDAKKFSFPIPKVEGLNFSFSGLKTSLLYFLRDNQKENKNFIEEERANLCASFQHTVVTYLLRQIQRGLTSTQINQIAICGGVSANSELRKQLVAFGEKNEVQVFIPPFKYCTDNAAMIGVAAHFLMKENQISDLKMVPLSRYPISN
ncbi:MAG: tRNA ((37)-N6)-threonylcarbamoyltransferase complex transferase subunit TsaD [Bacteroidota bacterium]|jgi:N6-L-threonylcarbamoyladenine synthase